MAATFDTLRFSKRLKEAGFTESQAEGLAEAIKATSAEVDLATKRDLKDMEIALRQDLKDVEIALRQDLKDVEVALKRDAELLEAKLTGEMGTRFERVAGELLLIKWMLGLLLGGVVALVLKAFFL